MRNDARKGTIAIRLGNENQKPLVVYVGGLNSFGFLVCRELNSTSIVFSEPDGDDLVDFDMKLLEKLSKEWRIENLKKQLAELTK